jgi:membrane protein required for colicin V production
MDWHLYFWDLALLVVGIIFIYKGFRKGLVNQIIWLISFAAGFFAASYFSFDLAQMLGFRLFNEGITTAVCFVVIFLSAIIILHLIGKWLTKILNLSVVGLANSLLGALLNGLIFFIIVMVVLNLGLFMTSKIDKYLQKTTVVSQVVKVDKWLMDKRIKERIEKVIDKLD